MKGMERTFCHICGSKLQPKQERCWYCPSCKQDYYDNPRPCVELAIFNSKGEVLLSKRAFEPMKGKWDMPGGFVDMNEVIEEAVLRELEEELQLPPEVISTPKYVRSYTGRYPWGKENYHTLVSVFVTKLKKEDIPIEPQDDVAKVKWVKPEDVDQSELSIPNLKEYIHEAYGILHT